MKHMVFIVGEYYPNFSAVGMCCNNIAEELSKQNKVTVICMKSYSGQLLTEDYRGQTILRVTYKWWDFRLKIKDKIKNSNGLIKKCYKLILNYVRLMGFLQIILSRISINKSLANAYLKELNNIKTPIDVIIPLCFPMEAVVAGMEYKKVESRIKLIPYLFDPFVESHTLHRTDWNRKIKMKSNIAVEKNMFELSTKVFCVNHLTSHFEKYNFSKGSIISTEHPLMKKYLNEKHIEKETNSDKINITYAGVFDRYIRNPEFFLRVMINQLSNNNAILHLYEYGNCEDIIDKYVEKSKGKIINHGFVTKDKVDEAIIKSDILICVGNIDNTQVPSKIFEYMSVGKPIVLFYSNDTDKNIEILKEYPLSICLKQDEDLIKENGEKFINFCKTYKDDSLNFEEIEKIYYYATPEFIAKKIAYEIDNELDKNYICKELS